ncbi:MAG: potassium channel family protein [archaeon]
MKVRWHLIFIICIFILALVGGSFAYHYVESWSILDSFYFVVVTVTTIGYGDFAPATSVGKVFTMFFAFFGVATALYILSTISSSMFRKHVGQEVSKIKKHVKEETEIKGQVSGNMRRAVRKKR